MMLEETPTRPTPLAMRARHYGPTAPPGQLNAAPFAVRFAADPADRKAQRELRHHGHAQGHASRSAGAPLDLLDDALREDLVHHALVGHSDLERAVACARVTSGHELHALARGRASHFDLESLPASHLDRSAWVDRIAVAEGHVDEGVLWALLAGLHRYLDWNDLRYLLCPALVASDEPGVVAAASLELARAGSAGARWTAPSQPDYVPEWSALPAPASDNCFSPWLTLLCTLGAKVCGGPAVDSGRGITLFLMRLDMREVQPQFRSALPGPGCWEPLAR